MDQKIEQAISNLGDLDDHARLETEELIRDYIQILESENEMFRERQKSNLTRRLEKLLALSQRADSEGKQVMVLDWDEPLALNHVNLYCTFHLGDKE